MRFLFSLFIIFFATGCHSATQHHDDKTERLALVPAQKCVKRGDSQAEVAKCLGTPTVMSKDVYGKDAWVYDRAARDVTYSNETGGFWLILGGNSNEAGGSNSNQRTKTLLIKFDDQGGVDDLTCYSSQYEVR